MGIGQNPTYKKIQFLDLTHSLTEEHSRNLVTKGKYDYHPNSLGTKIMAKEIYSLLPFAL